MLKNEILDILNFRHACKEFDLQQPISPADFSVILEAGRLSPSSFGLEPWKFVVLNNKELRDKIYPVTWGGQKQLLTAPHFVLILARSADDMKYDSEYVAQTFRDVHHSSDKILLDRQAHLKKFQERDFDLSTKRDLSNWSAKQSYIALANMMTTAAILGIDSCPICGFDMRAVEEILSQSGVLDKKHFNLVCMVAFGYRALEPRTKNRRDLKEIVEYFN